MKWLHQFTRMGPFRLPSRNAAVSFSVKTPENDADRIERKGVNPGYGRISLFALFGERTRLRVQRLTPRQPFGRATALVATRGGARGSDCGAQSGCTRGRVRSPFPRMFRIGKK